MTPAPLLDPRTCLCTACRVRRAIRADHDPGHPLRPRDATDALVTVLAEMLAHEPLHAARSTCAETLIGRAEQRVTHRIHHTPLR